MHLFAPITKFLHYLHRFVGGMRRTSKNKKQPKRSFPDHALFIDAGSGQNLLTSGVRFWMGRGNRVSLCFVRPARGSASLSGALKNKTQIDFHSSTPPF